MTKIHLLAATLGVALLASTAPAQERPRPRLGARADRANATQNGTQAAQPGEPGERCHRPGPSILTREERQKLRAAHQQALTDPAVKEAKEELLAARLKFRALMHAKLVEIDPDLAAIIEKIKAARGHHRGGLRGPGMGGAADDDAVAADVE